ncbi:peptide-methionine (S)-S-oxide reductase MsrA [Gelidibacter mesophilus]|uniref:peptide-methionine (S)-S-oxide reductase MsrA n=1 Tax=Gelidibacter mesophilus TaxID=169050 RepID=UPI0004278A3A|nr:peptide-methionine (S)-S-oxide reductase MsrA [Gelidibacter mesophilus]
MDEPVVSNSKIAMMTVGGGCFWCVEAVFNEIKGVENVFSGYMGGTVPGKPTYREVCSGLTGHAEVVQVKFDASVISYEDLLVVFMTSHDPTILNGQGADLGTQYRCVIYYYDGSQKDTAQLVVKEIASYYENPIFTEVSPAETFHLAEDVHQKYYANNPTEAYCIAMIQPKLAKLRKMHADKLKSA